MLSSGLHLLAAAVLFAFVWMLPLDFKILLVYHSSIHLNVFVSNMTTNDKIEALAKKLQTAGDLNRLKILCYLFTAKKACVSDISDHLGMSIATTSHHLQALAKEDLLASEREGKKICYKLGQAEINADLKKFICKYK